MRRCFSPALSALNSVARSDPPWAGVRRRRLALKSAAAVAQNLLNRREDEAALRDAVALARPGQELGPAGRVYAAFRVLAGPGDPLRPDRLSAVAADLQAPFDPQRAAELAAGRCHANLNLRREVRKSQLGLMQPSRLATSGTPRL